MQRLLMAGVDDVTLLWDGDDAGRDAAERTAKRIQSQVRVHIAELPEGKDPDQLPVAQVQSIVRQAVPYGELSHHLQRAGLVEQRRRAAR